MKIQLPIDVVLGGRQFIRSARSFGDRLRASSPSALDFIRHVALTLVGTTAHYSTFGRRTRSGELAGAELIWHVRWCDNRESGLSRAYHLDNIAYDFTSHRFDLAIGWR